MHSLINLQAGTGSVDMTPTANILSNVIISGSCNDTLIAANIAAAHKTSWSEAA
jgi:hypothetical protein